MRTTILKKYQAFFPVLFLVIMAGISCFTGVKLAHAVPATDIVPGGLNAAMGSALDQSNNHLYFVENNTGSLKRVSLYSPYTLNTIADGFNHPNDVELDLPHGLAYVTQQDGILYKVDISSFIGSPVAGSPITVGISDIVTFNIGAPQQLVLDLSNNQAYTVGKSDNILYRIDLTTGVKTLVFTTLTQPVGIAVTSDMQFAYITEQSVPPKISKIDLTLGAWVENVVTSGLTDPSYLTWTDTIQSSLYVVQQTSPPDNKILRVDLYSTPTTPYEIVTSAEGLASQPSGIVVAAASTPIYISTDHKIQKADLFGLSGNIFMGVGHIPSTDIDPIDGYATTAPGYFYQVKNAPFGGTLNIFLNLENFRSWGASHYEIWVDNGTGPARVTNLSWKTNKWDNTILKYKPFTMAPDPDDNDHSRYEIPIDGGIYDSGLWYPPYFALRWPSGDNGLYTFTIALYQKTGTTFIPIAIPVPMLPLNEMTLRVDNTPPIAEIHNIFQNKPPNTNIDSCVIVNNGNNEFKFKITANDAEGHLYSYGLKALYGDNKSIPNIYNDSYNNHINPPPPPYTPVLWNGITNKTVPATPTVVPCNCAYTFYLWAWGRTINGYNRIQYVKYHKSITIDLPTLSICP
ncbi:MAG: hypothetical protein PVG39_28485 [Desulfobacteraceae bacterium]